MVYGDAVGKDFFACGQQDKAKQCKFFTWAEDLHQGATGTESHAPAVDASVVCLCREPCILRTANSEANKGRQFYTCAQQDDANRCGIFGWADVERGPLCLCGASTFVSVSKKSGRPFFGCACKDREKSCNFFQWGDEDGSGTGSGGGGGQHQENTEGVSCGCNINARLLTVRKEGPNVGRTFYSCGNGKDGCGFFLWSDANDDATGSGSAAQAPGATGTRNFGGSTYAGRANGNATFADSGGNFGRPHRGGSFGGVGDNGADDSGCYKCGMCVFVVGVALVSMIGCARSRHSTR